MMKSLYIFLDESGNFDFAPSGTEYFVVCAYTTVDPSYSIPEIYKFKYSLLADGYEQEAFHATEDKQLVRNSFYNIISKGKGIYDFVYVKKKDLKPELQNKKNMYALLVKHLLGAILQHERLLGRTYENVVVVLDKVVTHLEKGYVGGVIRSELKRFKVKFHVYFFQTKADGNAQMADYGSWAKYISLARGENRPMKVIEHLSRVNMDILDTHI